MTLQSYKAKIEDPDLPVPKVDTIISEPIGVLLFHERMVRKWVYVCVCMCIYKEDV